MKDLLPGTKSKTRAFMVKILATPILFYAYIFFCLLYYAYFLLLFIEKILFEFPSSKEAFEEKFTWLFISFAGLSFIILPVIMAAFKLFLNNAQTFLTEVLQEIQKKKLAKDEKKKRI